MTTEATTEFRKRVEFLAGLTMPCPQCKGQPPCLCERVGHDHRPNCIACRRTGQVATFPMLTQSCGWCRWGYGIHECELRTIYTSAPMDTLLGRLEWLSRNVEAYRGFEVEIGMGLVAIDWYGYVIHRTRCNDTDMSPYERLIACLQEAIQKQAS